MFADAEAACGWEEELRAQGQAAPFTVRPAFGDAGAPDDLLDLADLFADDFLPSQLDYSNTPFALRAEDAAGARGLEKGNKVIIPPMVTRVRTQTGPTKPTNETKPSPRVMPSVAVSRPSTSGSGPVEVEKLERRERNREHAKQSRIRKRVLLDTLQDQLTNLRKVNSALRAVVQDHLPDVAARVLMDCTAEESTLLTEAAPALAGSAGSGRSAGPISSAQVLTQADFRLMRSLVNSLQCFLLTDPTQPDNPIVYVSQGFVYLTGYKREQVLGRNCRFLQGPDTDQAAVDLIRAGIRDGKDVGVCLLNYKADGTPFWNQFFLAALKDISGRVVNYVGVQCEVNVIRAEELKDSIRSMPVPEEP